MATLNDYLTELKASTEGLGFQCHKDTYDAAIKALEKQIPKKPKIHEILDEYSDCIYKDYFCHCPNCECYFGTLSATIKSRYCPVCGQALDWSGADE